MNEYFKNIAIQSKNFWTRENWGMIATSFIWLLIALIIQTALEIYLRTITGVAVGDLILDNIPMVNSEFFIIQGALASTFLAVFLLFTKPKFFCFGIKAFSLFIITRALMNSMTHLGYMPEALMHDGTAFGYPVYNVLYHKWNDFFFSGHTGMPIMMALIFWEEKSWRYIFLVIGAILAISVLLAHLHYSIDVFAAPFITYSLFALARHMFPKEFAYSRKAG